MMVVPASSSRRATVVTAVATPVPSVCGRVPIAPSHSRKEATFGRPHLDTGWVSAYTLQSLLTQVTARA